MFISKDMISEVTMEEYVSADNRKEILDRALGRENSLYESPKENLWSSIAKTPNQWW